MNPLTSTAASSEPSAHPVLELRSVSKIYRTDTIVTHAVHTLDLTLQPGEYVSLMGPSGSGKTSLMGILGLLDRPSQGEQYLAGERVDTLSENQRARYRNHYIGYVFQSFNLIGDLSVFENVELPLRYRGHMPGAERRERVEALLEEVGIAHRARHYPAQLSGGQAQRVAVARALVTEPALILADEPTGNLDSQTSHEIMQLLTNLNQDMGITVLMVTHEPEMAEYARRVIHFRDGHVERLQHNGGRD